ncbi:surface antigen [Plasmodium falciparum UGT5.1]|uniref:Surface antigen n=1 Tax=Plasmodium falciparum UGT5.1 TaxID=1237627 RepID=W7JVV1_PLAFA|nr:surface antigen [Plasmodium falciparum UGT5.1]
MYNVQHYIKIYNQRNHKSTTPHTPKIPTTRLLCECDIYTSIYDNDPQMKAVMENYNRQASERFKEYDERMNKNRKECKEQCDKEIQKIILKDKLDKELTEKFATLHTDIQNDAIPTCVCEKSLADKTEKFCLNCGKTMGGVAPGWGLVSGLVYAGWSQYVATTVAKAATNAGIKAGVKVGLVNVTKIVTELSKDTLVEIPSIEMLETLTTGISADNVTLSGIFNTLNSAMTGKYNYDTYSQFSMWIQNLAGNHRLYTRRYPTEVAAVETAFDNAKTGILTKAGNATSSLTTGITASIIAIVVIILIMVIIYLILRYRRKKKMKKKLQYIKLLEE